MRDFKFRAWNGQAMEYGGFSVHATGKIIPTDIGVITKVKEDSPLMRFTGLKDKNENDIYEWDILKITYPKDNCDPDYGVVKIGYYGDGEYVSRVQTWMAGDTIVSDPGGLWGGLYNEKEVVGNIHQNPELIEAKND